MFTWNLLLIPVWSPYTKKELSGWDFIPKLMYAPYKFFLGWENTSKLFIALCSDFNAQGLSAWMHTLLLSITIYKTTQGDLDDS